MPLNSTDGANPQVTLIADGSGNLFGTTNAGGASGDGTVFEITKTAGVYASTPTTLYAFTGGTDGANPVGGLIAEGSGNLLGSTSKGGLYGYGTLYELAKTAGGAYVSTPTTLVSFNNTDGANPEASLIAHGGNLFGTTLYGGQANAGTVFDYVLPTSTITTSGSYTTASWTAAGAAVVGTAADTGGPGVASVAVTIQDTTANKYWNGLSFVSGSTSVTASGTTSWSVAIPAAKLTSGDSYTVRSVAINSAGNPQFTPASATFFIVPAAPTSLTATAGNAQVTLNWTAPNGATSYDLYRGTSSGGESATPIATNVVGTAYTNTGLTVGTTYFY